MAGWRTLGQMLRLKVGPVMDRGPDGLIIAIPAAGTSHGGGAPGDEELGYEQHVAAVTILHQTRTHPESS